MLHKTRDLPVRQGTMLISALSGHLGKFGSVTTQEAAGAKAAITALRIEADQLPELARLALHGLEAQLAAINAEVDNLERRILAQHRENETSRRLATIPGVGPINASVMAASASVHVSVVRRDDESAAAGDRQNPGGQSASSALM